MPCGTALQVCCPQLSSYGTEWRCQEDITRSNINGGDVVVFTPAVLMDTHPLALVVARRENIQFNDKPLPLIPRPDLRVVPSNIPGPGRILNKVYISVGRVLEDRVNHLAHNRGWGPIATADRIEKAFGDSAKARQAELEILHRSSSKSGHHDTTALQRDCHKLMKYALP
jgi:hypothetical protein